MKNALLIYRVNSKNNIFNIGDYIQSLAAAQYFDKIDLLIEREKLDSYKGELIKLIMNGWFMHCPENWPPSNKIVPLFVAFHINKLAEKELISEKSINYLKQYQPIGCRDYHTVELLKSKGVDCYFSACLTLTLGLQYKYVYPRDGNVYFVDLPNPIFISFRSVCESIVAFILRYKTIHCIYKKRYNKFGVKSYLANIFFYARYNKVFTSRLLREAYYVQHEIKDDFNSECEKFEYAKRLLFKYAKASLVVTSRIHCALPCLGLETPVFFVYNPDASEVGNCRLKGLLDFFYVIKLKKNRMICEISSDKIDKGFKFKNKTLYQSYKDRLIDICLKFSKEK